jgi:hypothetical protein
MNLELPMEQTDNAQDRALDEALQMTFPASDPVAITPASLEKRKGDER